jgi:hypothetical protein
MNTNHTDVDTCDYPENDCNECYVPQPRIFDDADLLEVFARLALIWNDGTARFPSPWPWWF